MIAKITLSLALVFLSAASNAQDQTIPPLALTAIAVPLNPDDPTQNRVGDLRYLAGYHLTAEDENFGGISGLGTLAKAACNNNTGDAPCFADLPFVTDKGMHGVFKVNSQNPSLFLPKVYNFKPIPHLPSHLRAKIAGDAEAITQLGDATLVSFEQDHRIQVLNQPQPSFLPLPANISQLSNNGGLEVMAALADGRLFLMAERPVAKSGQHFAWMGTPSGGPLTMRYETRLVAPPTGYEPTDAALLPSGDILILLRHFTVKDGVSAKFMRVKKAVLDGAGPITGEIIATLNTALTVDNMEGISVIGTSADGNPIIAVISDDNFNSFQRTLLMIFEILS